MSYSSAPVGPLSPAYPGSRLASVARRRWPGYVGPHVRDVPSTEDAPGPRCADPYGSVTVGSRAKRAPCCPRWQSSGCADDVDVVKKRVDHGLLSTRGTILGAVLHAEHFAIE